MKCGKNRPKSIPKCKQNNMGGVRIWVTFCLADYIVIDKNIIDSLYAWLQKSP